MRVSLINNAKTTFTENVKHLILVADKIAFFEFWVHLHTSLR